MTPTLRRLDDGTRYYYLTFGQWIAALLGCGVLYLAVRFSPLSQRWTFTAVLLGLAFVSVAIAPLTGNALGLSRYLTAIVRSTVGPKQYRPIDQAPRPVRGGVLLHAAPATFVDEPALDGEFWQPDDAPGPA